MPRKIKPITTMGVKLYPQVGNQCWRYSLAHLLQLEPKQIPDFVKNNRVDFVTKTRKWLNNIGKGIVFSPTEEFTEKEENIKYNSDKYPQGDCIACLEAIIDGETDYHACFMRNGVLLEHPDSVVEHIDVIGYFIIYDLCQKKPQPIK